MRLRITFSKSGAAKYSGHLDLHKTWERIFRRAGLPLAYSQGFHPQPKIQLAAALPLGITSDCEIVDVWFTEEVDLEKAIVELKRAASPGIGILDVQPVVASLPPLQTLVRAADYAATVSDPPPDLAARAATLLAAPSLPREKRGKPYDLRPLIEALSVEGDVIHMRLSAREAATGRPEEVVDALGLMAQQVTLHRAALHFIDKTPPDPV
jgi:radical SAM-linked protein